MFIRIDIKIWLIDKSGSKKGSRKMREWCGNWYGDCWILRPLCMFGFISVVEEGDCARDWRRLGLFTFGAVG
jgi:hypothetical protein